MSHQIYRSCKETKREGLSWNERWIGHDNSLITCWEVGRELSKKEPELAVRAKNGELPVMGWKGGVDEKVKLKEKYVSLYYLAKWQGLRGEDLDINTSAVIEMVCTKTGVKVIYTSDIKKVS